MSKMIVSFFILVFLSFYTYASYDDQSVKNEVQATGFMVGNDSDLGGSFFYIVDKTSGICLAAIYGTPGNGGSGGLAEVSCDKLRKIPKINSYLGPKEEVKIAPAVQVTPVPAQSEITNPAPVQETIPTQGASESVSQ